MLKQHPFKPVIAVVLSFAVLAAPVYANPGNGNGNGNHGNGGHPGNSGNHHEHGNKGQHPNESKQKQGNRHSAGRPDRAESDIDVSHVRRLAVNYGLVGYPSLPPGIAKKVARGKPLPPGIAKKNLPASMINDLPYYPGYEWRAVGKDLVLIALSTAVVTAVINGVFD